MDEIDASRSPYELHDLRVQRFELSLVAGLVSTHRYGKGYASDGEGSA